MSASSALAPILSHLRAEPSRTWSIIITLYGDAVVPRGGSLWLGTLLEIFAATGVGGNVVRTAMSRLASDGWLERIKLGRNAFYRLAAKGEATFQAAARRIYGPYNPAWDGAFHLALVGETDAVLQAGLLERAGYAPLAPGVLIAAVPRSDADPELAGTIRLHATTDAESARRLANRVWPPERLEHGYSRFLTAFAPLHDTIVAGAAFSGLEALVARMLLVHEYRRLVLHDPLLPAVLRPPRWIGNAARRLCSKVYPALLKGSESWLDEHGLNEEGRLPTADASLFERFSG